MTIEGRKWDRLTKVMRQRVGTAGKTASSRETRIGTAWLGVRSCSAAAGPCVAGSMQNPLLQNRSPILVHLHCAGITNSARSLAGRDGCWIRRSLRLGDDVIAVHRVDGVIAVSVKYNGRNGAFDPAGCSRKIRPALPHSCECRGNVAGGATRQSRVDTDGRIKVWVSSSHYCSCGTSSRQPGDIHAPRFDTEVAHDLAGNARKERWLSLIALQISRAKPVPALKGIRRLGLRRIGDQDRAPAMMCSPTAPELVPSNIVRGAQMGIRQCCNS